MCTMVELLAALFYLCILCIHIHLWHFCLWLQSEPMQQQVLSYLLKTQRHFSDVWKNSLFGCFMLEQGDYIILQDVIVFCSKKYTHGMLLNVETLHQPLSCFSAKALMLKSNKLHRKKSTNPKVLLALIILKKVLNSNSLWIYSNMFFHQESIYISHTGTIRDEYSHSWLELKCEVSAGPGLTDESCLCSSKCQGNVKTPELPSEPTLKGQTRVNHQCDQASSQHQTSAKGQNISTWAG